MKKTLALAAALFASGSALAIDTTGLWQGPCQTRGDVSVKFRYQFIQNDDSTGVIKKEKQYFFDKNCTEWHKVNQKDVAFAIGEEVSEGVHELNVKVTPTVTLYNIVSINEYGQLVFADQAVREDAKRPQNLSSKDRIFNRIN